jgi:NAD(P)-dependent dehydrogenase (short-subunit alcohol dehydrogenase family)
MRDMSDLRVVIIGGSSGIGEATARLFALRGAEVVIAGRNAEKLDHALERIGSGDRRVLDATAPEAVVRFFADVGAFNHLVLSVSGGAGGGPFASLDLSRLRHGFEAKFWAYLTAMQATLPHIRQGGSITLVTAGSARAAMAGTAGLAAINGALEAMVRPLAVELAPVRVNAVSPGVIDTPWWSAVPAQQRDAMFAQAAEALPVGRVGTPEDVAEAIGFVATNGFMTGTVIECDGGGRFAPTMRPATPR